MKSNGITLVFTDVVGSSAAKRSAALGVEISARDRAYLDAIQVQHLRVVRSALEKYRGREIMTMGDAFFLTFEDPVDALRCCAAIQQRLVTHPIDTFSGPLCLRIGIHYGTPEYFENSWHGTDVDVAARAQAAGTSRQIIVTSAARERLGEVLGITFRPLGTFALKGVGDIELWDADYDQHGSRAAGLMSNEKKRRDRTLAIAALGLLALAALGLAGWHFWSERVREAEEAAAKKAGAPSSIIVAEFENKTGEPVFNQTLTQALTIQLQQSPMLDVVSSEHLRQSLQYLGKAQDAPLTPAAAKEIGIREGVKAYVTGDITKLGSAYLINVSVINPATGDSIAREQAEASDKDHVLDALSSVSTILRNKLGESLASIHKLDTPLGQATTPSLEAFRAYALGDADHDAGRDIPEAQGHYQEALDLDPNFAMAWARLGVVHIGSGETQKGIECLKRALLLSKNVSERERYYIEGFYHMYVTGDLEKAINVLELGTQTYPLDKGFQINLGIAQSNIGQQEASADSLRRAVELTPNSAIALANYLYQLTVLDRFSEAQKLVARMSALGLRDTADMTNFYSLHFLLGDTAAMARDIAVTQGRDDDYLMTNSVALAMEFSGRYREADRSWRHSAQQAAVQKAADVQASAILFRCTGRIVAGLRDNVPAEINSALALDQSKVTLVLAAAAAAGSNHPEIANPLMAKLEAQFPDDTIIRKAELPQNRAMLALAAGLPGVALRDLQDSEIFDLVSEGGYLRGLAFLDLHQGLEAAKAFRRATVYRGSALLANLQVYGQAQLGLARAYVQSGDSASAKKAYAALFVTWKDADDDLPQLVAARKEYAALK